MNRAVAAHDVAMLARADEIFDRLEAGGLDASDFGEVELHLLDPHEVERGDRLFGLVSTSVEQVAFIGGRWEFRDRRGVPFAWREWWQQVHVLRGFRGVDDTPPHGIVRGSVPDVVR